MAIRVRQAAPEDLSAITALLLQDAAERAASDGWLWPLANDATQKIAQAFSSEGQGGGSIRWLVAESAGEVVGVARCGLIPCPPIYHLAGQFVLVLFDDTVVSGTAPDGTLALLIEAGEREGQAMGAVSFLAACAKFQRDKLNALNAAGYSVVTDYLVKHRLTSLTSQAAVRPATAADVPAIVAMGGKSLAALSRANARMWTPHPDAAARFGAWMHYSLTLADRRIFVSAEREYEGFVIAQPLSFFHLPLTSERDHFGLIDDFWASEFAAPQGLSDTQNARNLIESAEVEFAQRGRTSAMVICAADWRSKQAFLRAAGYGDGNAWMLKA